MSQLLDYARYTANGLILLRPLGSFFAQSQIAQCSAIYRILPGAQVYHKGCSHLPRWWGFCG